MTMSVVGIRPVLLALMAVAFLVLVMATSVESTPGWKYRRMLHHKRRPVSVKRSSNVAASGFVCRRMGFFSHETDCTLFYRCVDYWGNGKHFSLFRFRCPAGTMFDPTLSVCNHPSWIQPPPKCLGGSVPRPPSGPSSGGGYPGGVVRPPGSGGGQQPGQGGSWGIPTTTEYATESTAMAAVGGGTTLAPCQTSSTETSTGPGPIMSPPTVAPTEISQPPTDSTPTIMSTESSVKPDGSSTPQPDGQGSQGSGQQPEGGSQGSGSVTGGQQVESSSTVQPEGSSTASASAEGSSTVQPDTGSQGTMQPDSGSGQVTEAPSVTGTVSSVSPVETTSTVAPSSSTASSSGSAPFVLICGDQEFHRHPLQCDLFYQCVWNAGVFNVNVFACPAGLYFDDYTSFCRLPEQTYPCQPVTIPPPSSTTPAVTASSESTTMSTASSSAIPSSTESTSEASSTASAATESTTTATTSAPTESTTTTTAKPPYTLAAGSMYNCKVPGHFPYQLDCIRFYRCFEVEPGVLKGLLYRCPAGYGYSEEKERCHRLETLPPCDRSNQKLGDYPIPIISLEETTEVRVEDFDSFFSNPNYFYLPRYSKKK